MSKERDEWNMPLFQVVIYYLGINADAKSYIDVGELAQSINLKTD